MHTTAIELSGYRAIITNKLPYVLLGTAGSQGNETLLITRGTGWEGLTVKAVFHPQRIEALVPASGEMDVPWEVTARPLRAEESGKIVFHGVDESTGRVLVTHDIEYKLSSHSPADGTPPGTPTPSIWAQWVADAGGVVNEAAAVVGREAALLAQINAEAGQAAAAAKQSAETAAKIVNADATLTVSGAAADAAVTGEKLTALTCDVQAAYQSLDLLELPFSKQYALSLTGDLSVDTNFNATDIIQVKPNEVVKYRLHYGASFAGICGWDKNFKGRALLSADTLEVRSGYLTIPADICCITASSLNMDITDFTCSILTASPARDLLTVGTRKNDFATIQAAVNAINDRDNTTPYTIFVRNGTYPSFKTYSTLVPRGKLRHISIIGEDRERTIISDSQNSTFESAGCLENMTLIDTDTAFVPSGTANVDYDSEGGYALHIDTNFNNGASVDVLVRNCTFTSYKGHAVGIGLWPNQHIKFIDCSMTRMAGETANAYAGYCGVLVHNTALNDQQLQYCDFENCQIRSAFDNALLICDAVPDSTGLPSELTVLFRNNTIFSAVNGFDCILRTAPADESKLSGTGITLADSSFGNTNAVLNQPIGTVAHTA
jgi:hypothetical protein